ncbi:MAG: hypothetical protein U0790_03680 [Isosphaeraceae bacterium]
MRRTAVRHDQNLAAAERTFPVSSTWRLRYRFSHAVGGWKITRVNETGCVPPTGFRVGDVILRVGSLPAAPTRTLDDLFHVAIRSRRRVLIFREAVTGDLVRAVF